MTMNDPLLALLAGLCLLLHACIAILMDALRFGSLGYTRIKLQKRIDDPIVLDMHMKRMEDYFKDEGGNLRELEWVSVLLLMLGLMSAVYAFAYYPDATQIDHELVFQVMLVYSILYFIMGSYLIRAFSEPFAEVILIICFPLWRVIHYGMMPLTLLLHGVQLVLVRILGHKLEEEEEEKEQKILDSMEDGKKAGVFEDSEQEMIENLIEFKDRDVGEVMTPRTDMVAVAVDADLSAVVGEMREQSFSRIVVFEGNRDNIIGFVHVRDILPYWNEDEKIPPLKDLLHKPYFVPETKKIRTLFQELKNQHLHIAVVLDEYGGTAGLITLEDILEEIVGEIVDEHQEEEEVLYQLINERELSLSAKLRVTELNEIFGLEIEEDDHYDSVGGLLISRLGRIPVQDEQGEFKDLGLKYKVLSANQRRIERILLTKTEQKVDL